MSLSFFETIFYMIWRGIAIGIIISAPMGPVGILCVQRTLEKGRRTGFFTGIGAAISDMFYCILTGFGLSFIEDFLTRNHNIIQLIGSVVLIGFGIYLFKSNPTRNLKKPEEGISDKRNILNGFLFTFSNPLIIFLIIGLFARFNFLVPEIQAYHYVIGFISIGFGALLWWWVVTFFVAKLRSHFNLRSMWLINKIIGGIILIFAVVGIVTAITEMASASPRPSPSPKGQDIYINSSRGFGNFNNATDSILIISGCKSDTVSDLIAIPSSSAFEWSFRAANINNAAATRYPASDGKKRSHPGWGIVIKHKSGESETVSIHTIDNPTDPLYSSPQTVVENRSGLIRSLSKEIDHFTGFNAWHLSFDRGELTLSGGDREYKPIMSWKTALQSVDSIGFFVASAGRLQVDYLSIKFPLSTELSQTTEYGNPDILRTHLLRSSDSLEGIWKVFDRMLDDDFLLAGGDYTLAMIKEDDDYVLIYLDGAETEASRWKPGMIKARLIETGFKDVFNLHWVDATGHEIPDEGKAQLEPPLLTLTLPMHSSTLRLRKIQPEKYFNSIY